MRRISWVLAMLLCVTVVLAGCGGKKDSASVVKDLNNVVDKLQSKDGSYKGKGNMTLYTGEKPQQYDVDVWYQNPSYYRISLKNAQKDITQIVLRNDDGVFVLTPSLNKSFRFQSDWPDNQGQVYLYQTLVQGIITDNARQFVDDKDSYVFDVEANYHSQSLVRQKIWLNKDSYAPKQVQVSDSEANVVVEVKFNEFEFNAKFDKDSFDMQRNMTAMGDDAIGTLAQVDEFGNEIVTDLSSETQSEPVTKELGSFGVLEPDYLPDGVVLNDYTKIANSKDHAVVLRYDGTYQYTVMEARPLDRAVSLAPGSVIDLGFTVGLLTGEQEQQRTLTWMDDGIEFRITSANLPVPEMMKVAESLSEQTGK